MPSIQFIDDSNTQTSIYTTNTGQITSQEEQELNQKLGLVLPQGLITESIPMWLSYFRLIRFMYIKEILPVENVPQMLADFAEIPDRYKSEFIGKLYDMAQDQINKIISLEELHAAADLENQIQELIAKLPPELATQFQQEVLGKQILEASPEIINMAQDDQQQEVLRNLYSALDKRNRLDVREMNLGQTLAPADIVDRFDLDQPATPKYPPLPSQNTPNPSYSQTTVNRKANLDDLLNKSRNPQP